MCATISACGQYRYTLERSWDKSLPCIHWIMLNPSKADATIDDRTIQKVIAFSIRWGYGSAVVMNLFAWRSKNPRDLKTTQDPIGPENDRCLSSVTSPVVVAWGANSLAMKRASHVLQRLPSPVYCLKMNLNGSPKHPLYVSHDSNLIPFPFPSP